MDKATCAEIAKKLILADHIPTIFKVGEDNYEIVAADPDGVLINTIKNFQDNNPPVVAKGKVVRYT